MPALISQPRSTTSDRGVSVARKNLSDRLVRRLFWHADNSRVFLLWMRPRPPKVPKPLFECHQKGADLVPFLIHRFERFSRFLAMPP